MPNSLHNVYSQLCNEESSHNTNIDTQNNYAPEALVATISIHRHPMCTDKL